MLLKDLSINNKGYYGIGASSCSFNCNFPQYLRITDIDDFGFVNNLNCSINPNEYPDYNKYFLSKYDIVFARTGNSTGRNYMYLGDEKKVVFAGFLIKFSIDPDKVNPLYVKYFCQSNKYWNNIQEIFTGSTRPNINEKTFSMLDIPLVSAELQQHIVDIIGSLDDKIENNNKLLEKCYIFLNLNMKKLLIGKDKKIISSFDDIEIISSGIDKFNNSKIYLDTSCVSDNSIVDISNKVTYTDRPSRANMKPIKNSVWFAKLKSSPKHIIVKDYSDEILDNCIFSTGFLGIKIDNEKFNLLSTYFTSDVFEKEKDSLSIGATMQSINNVTFKGMYIPDFSPTDYISFNNLSEPILKLIYKTELENIKLKKLKNIYLAKFF